MVVILNRAMRMTKRQVLTLDTPPCVVHEKNRNELQCENVRLAVTERDEDNNDRRGVVVEIFKW